ncbi:MAG: hypothetical protein JNK05_34690 [Myxococcales bacterium]|nr:hypothetical protein [Myxococcales bacterium]
MLIVDLAANERVERVISAHRREPLVIRVRGASAVRVVDDRGVVIERAADNDSDEVAIEVDRARLDAWLRTLTLSVRAQRARVAHPRSDGASDGAWHDVALVRVIPRRTRFVRGVAVAIGALSALLWLSALPSAASWSRGALDVASAIAALVLIWCATRSRRVWAPALSLVGSVVVVAIDVGSWANTVATLNVGHAFERDGRRVPEGWSRDTIAAPWIRVWWNDLTYVTRDSIAVHGCPSDRRARYAERWWRAIARPTVMSFDHARYAAVGRSFVSDDLRQTRGVECGDGSSYCCVDFDRSPDRERLTLDLPSVAREEFNAEAIAPRITIRPGAVLFDRAGEDRFREIEVVSTGVNWSKVSVESPDITLEWQRAGDVSAPARLLFPLADSGPLLRLSIVAGGRPLNAELSAHWIPSRIRVLSVVPGTVAELRRGGRSVSIDRDSSVSVWGVNADDAASDTSVVLASVSGTTGRPSWSPRWARFELVGPELLSDEVFIDSGSEGAGRAAVRCRTAPGAPRRLFAVRLHRSIRSLVNLSLDGFGQLLWWSWPGYEGDLAFLCGDRTRMSQQSFFARIGDPTALQRVAVVLRESASGEMVLEPASARASSRDRRR